MSVRAETAMNIIAALSDSERARLFAMPQMIEYSEDVEFPKTDRSPLMTDEQAVEYILNLYRNAHVKCKSSTARSRP
jgi:hypothetical protein